MTATNEAVRILADSGDQAAAVRLACIELVLQTTDTPADQAATQAEMIHDYVMAGSGPANPWSKEHWNLTGQMSMLQHNPGLARKMKAEAALGGGNDNA